MDCKKEILLLRADLQKHVNAKYKQGATNYFKEQIRPHGVRLPTVHKIAAEHFKRLRKQGWSKADFFALAEELQKTGWFEETTAAYSMLEHLEREFIEDDFATFAFWLEKYVSNWAHCDHLTNHHVGYLLEKYPQLVKRLYPHAKSKNRWMKRSACTSLILPARHGLFLSDCLKIAQILHQDRDDLVLKGAGWMLREAGKRHEDAVYNFLLQIRKKAGRVLLRYAIEKMPKQRKEAVLYG
ncbi:DNA alkylation repair enzyme [Candidatus Gugararchaeum adminiculabundum]|nr:DNA alkylation repair enzyme [Candidatus Gugararchaeum adminiculabundum]